RVIWRIRSFLTVFFTRYKSGKQEQTKALLLRCAFCKKESCEAGFSACGGSRKRHSSIPPQCDPCEAFLFYRTHFPMK
ncbi:MAG: hypothetical protein EGP94_04380, partial [Lachnospiraceae bacterium]|nr:hypothetical protein [Lachnospiraceae bacterium]